MPLSIAQYAVRVTGTVGDVAKLRYQIDTYLHQRNPNAPAVGRYYADFGARFGIRPEIAVGQAIVETASFRFGGQVPASYHNPCGMKCSGSFVRFATWEQGVHAHLERLNCYIRPRDESGEGGKYDPCYGHWRYDEIKKMGYEPDTVMGVVSLWTGKCDCDSKNLGYDVCIENCMTNKLRYAQAVVQHAEAILKIPYTPGASDTSPAPTPGVSSFAMPWWGWALALVGVGVAGVGIVVYRKKGGGSHAGSRGRATTY